MHLRKDSHKRKDGTVRTRASIAHNVRVSDGKGGSVSKPVEILPLGRLEDVDERAVGGLIDTLRTLQRQLRDAGANATASALDEAVALQLAVKPVVTTLRVLVSKQVGLRMVVEQVWKELGLAKVVRGIEADHCRELPLERIVFGMVLNRLADPMSKRACNDWLKDTAWFPEAEDWTANDFYRALDHLWRHSGRVMAGLLEGALGRADPEDRNRLLLDTTRIFTECDLDDDAIDVLMREWTAHDLEKGPRPEDPRPQVVNRPSLRLRGHSKDHRPHQPQVIVALGALPGGVPVWQAVYPGNTSDKAVTLDAAKEVLPTWRKENPGGRLVVTMDAGMAGVPNLRRLAALGADVGWLAGCPVRNNPIVDGILMTPGCWATVSKGHGDKWELRHVEVPEAQRAVRDRPERLIIVRSPARERRDRRKLDNHLEDVKQLLSRGTQAATDGVAHPILRKPSLARLVRTEGDKIRLDDQKVALEHARCGVKVMRTTEVAQDPGKTLADYDGLLDVEERFKDFKHVIDFRPMHHRATRRIEAHALICLLSVVVARHVERATGRKWPSIAKVMNNVHAVQVSQGSATWWQRSDIRGDALAILSKLGLTPGVERWASDGVLLTTRAKE